MEDIDALWKRYRKTGSIEDRNRLAEKFLILVDRVAYSMSRKVPRGVSLDDLKSHGYLGLLDAVERFDPERGFLFRTYAVQRIRGSILDGLRNDDYVPRLMRSTANRVEKAYEIVEREKTGPATDRELAGELNVSIKDLDRILLEVGPVLSSGAVVPRKILDRDRITLPDMALREDKGKKTPLEAAEREDLIHWCLQGLDRRERLIVRLYYVYDLTIAEIGLALGLTESRLCQIHAKVLSRIREKVAA